MNPTTFFWKIGVDSEKPLISTIFTAKDLYIPKHGFSLLFTEECFITVIR